MFFIFAASLDIMCNNAVSRHLAEHELYKKIKGKRFSNFLNPNTQLGSDFSHYRRMGAWLELMSEALGLKVKDNISLLLEPRSLVYPAGSANLPNELNLLLRNILADIHPEVNWTEFSFYNGSVSDDQIDAVIMAYRNRFGISLKKAMRGILD